MLSIRRFSEASGVRRLSGFGGAVASMAPAILPPSSMPAAEAVNSIVNGETASSDKASSGGGLHTCFPSSCAALRCPVASGSASLRNQR